jgi:hypothetical protein
VVPLTPTAVEPLIGPGPGGREPGWLPSTPPEAAPSKRQRRRTATEIVVTTRTEADLDAFKALLAFEKACHEAVESIIRETLRPGEDFGIVHDRGNSRRPGCKTQDYQGWSRCGSCHRKPDLWLAGAEKVAKRMGCLISEPVVATDIMQAIGPAAGPWIAFRCQVVKRSTGEVQGHGIGARSIATHEGDLNAAMKMGRKSAIIDAVKSTFALSGFFAQDTADVIEQGVAGGEAADRKAAGSGEHASPPVPPGAAPSPPAAPAPDYQAQATRMLTWLGATAEQVDTIYGLAGVAMGEILSATKWAAVRDVLLGVKDTLKAVGVGTTDADQAEARNVFAGWIRSRRLPGTAASAVVPETLPEGADTLLDAEPAIAAAQATVERIIDACGLGFADTFRFLRLVGRPEAEAPRTWWVPTERLLRGGFAKAMQAIQGWAVLNPESRQVHARAWLDAREAEAAAKAAKK